MGARQLNHRLVKINRSYTVEEVARLYGAHRNTVRSWIERGLPTCDDRRPLLILGRDLAAFLHARRTKNRCPCRPGEIYCMRCRAPKLPAGNMSDYQSVTATLGNLVAICPDCDAIMNRRVSRTKLELIRGNLDITMPQAHRHIDESPKPSVNCDLR